jgi:hypothetical protein
MLYYIDLCKYTFAQRRSRLTTHFLERIPVVKRHMTKVEYCYSCTLCLVVINIAGLAKEKKDSWRISLTS